VSGSSGNGGINSFARARFLMAGPQIGSFTASPNPGNPVASGSNVMLTASGITDANPGATVRRVGFYLDNDGDGTPGARHRPATGLRHAERRRHLDPHLDLGDPLALALIVQ
jgi:hypothetical protein